MFATRKGTTSARKHDHIYSSSDKLQIKLYLGNYVRKSIDFNDFVMTACPLHFLHQNVYNEVILYTAICLSYCSDRADEIALV